MSHKDKDKCTDNEDSISKLGEFRNEMAKSVWLIKMAVIDRLDTKSAYYQCVTGVCIHPHGYILTSLNVLKTFQTSMSIHPAGIVGRTESEREFEVLEVFWSNGNLLIFKVKHRSKSVSYPFSHLPDKIVGMKSKLLFLGISDDEDFTGYECQLSHPVGKLKDLVEDNGKLPKLYPTQEPNDDGLYLPIIGLDFNENLGTYITKVVRDKEIYLQETIMSYTTGSPIFDRSSGNLVGIVTMGMSELCLATPLVEDSLEGFRDKLRPHKKQYEHKKNHVEKLVDAEGSKQMADVPPDILPATWKKMVDSVWVLRVKLDKRKPEVESDRFEYLYTSGVCISKDGLILTSSQVCPEVCSKIAQVPHLIEGRLFTDDHYRILRVKEVGEGWAVLSPAKVSDEECFQISQISDEEISSGLDLLTIGHPWGMTFSVLKGRVIHQCQFDPENLDSDEAIYVHKDYVTVGEVVKEIFELDRTTGLKLELDHSFSSPLVPIEGFFHNNGLSGSPLFDYSGSVRGIIWFGNDIGVYGLPINQFLHEQNLTVWHMQSTNSYMSRIVQYDT